MDPSKMKVVDLRSELGALGLDTKGNKPALVERLKKALESKTGKVFADTTILDTSTEDAEDTPKRPGPASRTTRRASSSRVAGTPSKNGEDEDESTPVRAALRTTRRTSSSRLVDGQVKSRDDLPETIEEDMKEEESSKPAPKPVPAPAFVGPRAKPDDEVYSIDDEKSQSPIEVKDDVNDEDDSMEASVHQESKKKDDEKMEVDDKKDDAEDEDAEKDKEKDKNRELTEEEEWAIMNERLKAKEEERREQERLLAEERAKKLEELSQVGANPRKLTRFKYRQGKRAWWNNYYGGVGCTGEALTLPEEAIKAGKKEVPTEVKAVSEPELSDHKITLSWYDSDLNQHLELPELTSVVPLTEGVFAHAWAGARATHGVTEGRVCFEVRIGSVVTSMETGDKEPVGSGLRVGWSTEDSSLHLGEGEFSWGFETNGRAVHNGEFKEYGQQVNEGDVIGAYLDLSSNRCRMSYTVNGVELGVAYEFDRNDEDKPLFPHILTKNISYKVNFGYEKYNLLTKTKVLRYVERIPVAQAIEEKKALEAEIKRKKEEIAKREKERRDREKRDREERQRKKREERERLEKERKEKEAQEKKDKGEEVKPAEEPEKMEEVSEGDKDKDSAPKENGESSEKPPEVEVKEEPMDTEPPAPAPPPDVHEAEVKGEPATGTDDDVQVVSMEVFMKSPTIDKRIKFVDRVTTVEELDGTEGCLVPGYILLAHADLVDGPRRPATLADCEVILMVGMPGSGKTYWAKQHVAANPEKRYNVISTGALFDKMKVDCKPFRTSYEGRWDAMVVKCAKCVLKLLEMAKGRRRNFILDQRRKLREFDGYRRVAVVIVTDEETYRDRQKRREEADGKEVPDGAIGDMKANFSLPEKGTWLDDVIYPELNEEEAKKVVEAFHKEAKAAGVVKEKRSRSATREAPPAKRQRSGGDKPRHGGRNDRRSRDPPRDRAEDRWGIGGGASGGGGGGGRWGPVSRAGGGGGGRGGGGGGRWGRERDGPGIPPPGPPARFDRWGPPPARANEFGRDRDGFRGGRGGGGGGGMGGPRGDRAPPGRGPAGPGNDPARFRPERTSRPPPQDKRPPNAPPPGGAGGMGGGVGGWQRGAGGAAGGAPRGGGQMRPAQRNAPQKDGQNQMSQNQNNPQQNQQGWNQWAGGWGGWGGNWNQNQAGWGNWSNWPNWGGSQGGSGGNQAGGAGGAGGKGQGTQATAQWPANYTAQQWYQWQQWQQQQQQWQGYQQGNQGGAGNAPDAQAWAQYYQNYSGANAAANANAAVGDKK